MEFLQTYAKEIVALLVPFITWLLNSSQRHRARLFIARMHQFTFLIQEPLHDPEGKLLTPTQTVRTASHMVQNVGKKSASNIEVVLNWKPRCINLWPVRSFEEKIAADNRYVLVFASLAPGEVVGMELLDINRDLPQVLTVRADECTVKAVDMAPQRVWPGWVQKLGAFLVWMGLAATAYVILVGLQWLVLRTPSA